MHLGTRLIQNGVARATNQTEIKRIKVLNLTAGIALFHAVFFLVFDFITDSNSVEKLWALLLETVFFLLILFFQSKGLFKVARLSFMVVVVMLLFYHCNFAFKGYYGEYQYFVVPLFSLFLFDKYYLHYALLLLSIAAFYLPNLYFHIYPDKYFGYLNALLLFIGIFLIMDFFKRSSERNEKALEQQLKENLALQKTLDEKNRELQSLNAFQNHFFVNIAHEMNTPITLLKGRAHRLLKQTQDSELRQEVEKINTQVGKLESLTLNVMDISKINAKTLVLDKKIVSVNKLVQRIFLEFQPIYEKKGVGLLPELDAKDPYAKADIVYLERVLGNLLSNAHKFTPTGGQVVMNVETSMDQVLLTISDDGIGVPEADIALIFERFYQSKNEVNNVSGSGIGLAFAKEVIALHEGTITAKNNKNGGLSVVISIQRTQNSENAVATKKVLPAKLAAVLGKKILVVDDNKEMREYLVSILSDFNTVTAENGTEAMEVIQQMRIDAILTDYMMPVMDGKQFVSELKKNGHNIPTIVITARADMHSKLNMLALGVDDYLHKPFVEEELLLRLKNVLVNNAARNAVEAEENNPEPLSDKATVVAQCVALVRANLSNSYYGVAQLSENMGVSERTLYRTLKKETGLSPNLFIRELKLAEVRKRVESNTKITLNELATSVGLTNGTYLNQLYKERFGKAIDTYQ